MEAQGAGDTGLVDDHEHSLTLYLSLPFDTLSYAILSFRLASAPLSA